MRLVIVAPHRDRLIIIDLIVEFRFVIMADTRVRP